MNDSERYDIIRRRENDPTFVFGVTTTRIACRSGCPARTPLARNVVFFDDIETARTAGYRPCKRCAPGEPTVDDERRELVTRACARFDADADASLDEVAREVGLSRFHFQRIFREIVGLTPGRYRRTLRDRRFRASLADGEPVARAMHDAGFGSSSRVHEADPFGMTPSAFREGAAGERIAFATAACTLGRVLAAATTRGICAIELGDDDATVLALLERDFPRATIERDDARLAERLRSVVALVDGATPAADLALDIRGTAFQRRVWEALRQIPTGERRTYGELAATLDAGGPRAVANACARNPIAVAVPCHRVVGADGALHGYRWGLARKASLLRRERRIVEER